MNKRIQALAIEAEDYADSIVDAGGEFHPAYTQKLAELIVRECADVLVTEMNRLDSLDRVVAAQTMDTSQVLIKRHFGVEE